MARFYAEIKGSRGEATRMGSEKSGMRGHIRGWNIGACVYMDVNPNGEDVVSVYLTSGSNGHKDSRLLGRFTEKDLDK
jgi:hypothetical protein